ncbi:GNAT family N-acetyltransferase [Agromyces soli]
MADREPPHGAAHAVRREPVGLDDPRLLEILHEVLRERLPGLPEASVAPLVAMQARAKTRSLLDAHPDASAELVSLDGVVVGYLVIAPVPGGLHLADLAVRTAERGRGIGGAVLERLEAQADAVDAELGLTVWHDEPARRLYERHGFETVAVDDAGAAAVPGYLALRRARCSTRRTASPCNGDTSTSSSSAQ